MRISAVLELRVSDGPSAHQARLDLARTGPDAVRLYVESATPPDMALIDALVRLERPVQVTGPNWPTVARWRRYIATHEPQAVPEVPDPWDSILPEVKE